jgi:hypothetical protein
MEAIFAVIWIDALIYGAVGTLFLQIATILCFAPSLMQAIRDKREQGSLEPASQTVLGSLVRWTARIDSNLGNTADTGSLANVVREMSLRDWDLFVSVRSSRHEVDSEEVRLLNVRLLERLRSGQDREVRVSGNDRTKTTTVSGDR